MEQADVTDSTPCSPSGGGTRQGHRPPRRLQPWPPSSEAPVAAARRSLGSLFNMVQAAQEWGVTRLGLASTIGVYGGAIPPGAHSPRTPR